jgi:hypothetical protein
MFNIFIYFNFIHLNSVDVSQLQMLADVMISAANRFLP